MNGPVATAAVAAGGALGASLRWGIAERWDTAERWGMTDTTFPWTTLGINVIGCLAMGVLLALVRRPGAPAWLRPFVGTGLLGGFTTYSAFALESQRFLEAGQLTLATAYVATTVALTVVAVALGTRVAGGGEPRHA